MTEANSSFARLVGRPVEQLPGTLAVDYLAPIQPNGEAAQEVFDQHLGRALAGEHGSFVSYVLRGDRSEES